MIYRSALVVLSLMWAVTAKDYDFIVVGAGSAGSIVSSELVKSGADVLLIEAGGDNTDPAIDSLRSYFDLAFGALFNPFSGFKWIQWGYFSTEQTLAGAGAGATPKTFGIPRGRVLGGSHSINACAYVQANADDFNNIAAEVNDNMWRWRRTQRLRNKLERTIGITKLGKTQTGALDFIATAHEVLGFPFNSNPTQGDQYGISPSFWTGKESSEGGIRTTAFDAFVLPVLKSSNRRGTIDVVTFHQVQHLIFDENDSTKVVGVSTMNVRSNVATEFRALKEVILSSGTYNTPQILMLSGIGPQAHLNDLGLATKIDLPGVGSNLRDHYSVATFWDLKNLPEGAPFLFQSPSLNMFGPEQQGQPSFQFELAGNFGSVVPLRQVSTGTVRLQSSDPMASPIIDPNVLSTSSDVDNMVDGLENYLLPFFQGLIDKNLVTTNSLSPSASAEEIRQYVIERFDTNHHPVGTCKIGSSSDPMAVVDSNFIVRGTANLRVIDASIFPEVPSGNINGPTMTAALLGARKIKLAHRSSMTLDADDEEEDDGNHVRKNV
jgi:choline dehydrogenase|uniref:Glucose-methanol-choline oxidoreductase N-terminal domain-containing protein n=1 Tax=Phaeodactylum tricornutum TaxID=2850 RepID=A0A8J9X4R4_PHATR